MNTHWHSDHVGGNALLQAAGAGIAASAPTPRPSPAATRAAARPSTSTSRSPRTPSTNRCTTARSLRLGDADWQVVRTPGHTPGHLSLWQPEERLLVVGDALSDYDVGWVNLALDGPDAAATALASLHRLADLEPARAAARVTDRSLPTPAQRFATALRRAQRLVDDPDGAVWYGARRIFAFALMIRNGIPADERRALPARTSVADRRGPTAEPNTRGPRRRAGRHHARQRRRHHPRRAAVRNR